MTQTENPVLEKLEDRVLTVTLNRPRKRNAMTVEMNEILHDVLHKAAINSEVGAVVLTGGGDNFSVGADLNVLPGSRGGAEKSDEELAKMAAGNTLLLHEMPKPTIARICGAAAGGGLALALGCDLRIASSSAKLNFAYTRIALSGDLAGVYMLQHWVGPAKARELALLCPVLTAEEALQTGLINRVSADEMLDDATYGMARELANGPTEALGRIKSNLNGAMNLAKEDYLNLEAANLLEGLQSSEFREAAQAFLGKRRPVFHKD